MISLKRRWETHTWNYDRSLLSVNPIVRCDVLHVLNRDGQWSMRTVVNADSGKEKCVILQYCMLPPGFMQPCSHRVVDVKAVRMKSGTTRLSTGPAGRITICQIGYSAQLSTSKTSFMSLSLCIELRFRLFFLLLSLNLLGHTQIHH